jgi:hypothetical protein
MTFHEFVDPAGKRISSRVRKITKIHFRKKITGAHILIRFELLLSAGM